jgi:folate-binding protein YgfZ
MVRSGHGIVAVRPGVLRLKGVDALDFLQRMSTNDFTRLDRPLTTIFVTEKGRMLDIVTAIPLEDGIVLLTSEGRGAKLKAWLEKFIITEAIEISDITDDYHCYYIIGPESQHRVLELAGQASGSGRPPAPIVKNPLSDLPWHLLGLDSSVSVQIREAEFISRESCETLRVEEGIPSMQDDVDETTNPLELGLEKLISFTKGCYIGQEVIARLDTYEKTARRFVGLLIGERPEGILGKGELIGDSQVVGFTTSHVYSPLLGKEIALGFVKSRSRDENLFFRRAGSDENRAVKVVQPPFRPHGG